MLALAGVQAALTVYLLTRVVEQSVRLVSPALDRVDDLAHIESDLLRLRTLEYSSIWSTSDSVRQEYRLEMNALRDDIDRRLQAYRGLDPDPKLLSALGTIDESYRQYLDAQQGVIADVDQGNQTAALWAYLRFQPSFQNLDSQLHAMRHQEYAATEDLRDQMVQAVVWARWPLGIVVMLVAAVETGLGWHVSRRIAERLDVLLQGARRIAEEDFTEPVRPPPEPELATLAETLNAVMKSLAAHNAERARLEEERQRLARERLNQVVQAQEAERARISRELHDQAAQSLTALRYGLARIQQITRDDAVTAEVDRLMTLAGQTSGQISALARDLRPSVLDDLGLVPALRSYAREFSERIGIPVKVTINGTLPRLAQEAETTVFRVVQEALTNVAKHAQADYVAVDLAIQSDQLQVEVRDDGRGFDRETVGPGNHLNSTNGSGLGLIGIRERVELLGGHMELTCESEGGTRLRVIFPLQRNIRASPSPVAEEVATR